MAYLGRDPIHGSSQVQVFAPNGVATTFSLDFSIGSTGSILLIKNGVVQQPNIDFTLINGGSSISITGAPINAGVSLYCIYLSTQYLQNTIADNSISADKLSSNIRGRFPNDVIVPAIGSTSLSYGVGKFFVLGNNTSYTLTLPSAPAIGDMFWLTRPVSNSINAITVSVDTGGNNISSGDTNVALTTLNGASVSILLDKLANTDSRRTRWFVYLGTVASENIGWFMYRIDAF